MDRAYFSADSDTFHQMSPGEIFAALVHNHHFAADQLQQMAWNAEIAHLQGVASHLSGGHIFLEFAIPRMGKRVDALIVYRGVVFVIEYKVGAKAFESHAVDQVLDYALDLKNFHSGTHPLTVIPILVATGAPDASVETEIWSDGVVRPSLTNRERFLDYLVALAEHFKGRELDVSAWEASPYKPTPTIVEAAQALYQGHDVEEISRSEAGAENLSLTAAFIGDVIERSKANGEKSICFVTGVPGSGKTLAGLNVANTRMSAHEDEHAVFLSGNGPLVTVLREALAIDEVRIAKEQHGNRLKKKDALRHASTFIQNIHHFRDENLKTESAPAEKVVVFDEAQRAWTKEQASNFMRTKRGVADFDMSEPGFLLSVMDRHEDWCVVVCLIGGGQEINTGEAGLEEWFAAIEAQNTPWRVYVSDRLTGSDYLGSEAAATPKELTRTQSPALHLSVSVRSFRAEALSEFVGAIIDGDADRAKKLHEQLEHYPIALTRDLEAARNWLRQRARGSERYGLVASSNALRLRPEGIHVKAKIDPAKWFLADKADVRSSYALEDAATEFDVQGLELDWAGVCWDANLRWQNDHWEPFNFHGTRWRKVNDPIRVAYLANTYRVLLTRARQGMVIFVPEGSAIDQTRYPEHYNSTFDFLRSCGIDSVR
jgi:hypothetical protein